MSFTHGGNYRIFEWQLVGNTIYIENTRGRQHSYELTEILDIFTWLKATFGYGWFPLANNVKLMGRGQEKDGLCTAILDLTPKDITHAQGSSYLGVVLEEVGIFKWNGKKKGIEWRIVKAPASVKKLKQLIAGAK
jgi:hypothetical protein